MGAAEVNAPVDFLVTGRAHDFYGPVHGSRAFTVENGPPWWPTLAARVLRIAREAPILDRAALQRAVDFLRSIIHLNPPMPILVDTAHGGVQFEWSSANIEIEIAFEPDGSTPVVADDLDTGEEEVGDFADVHQAVEKMLITMCTRLGG